MAKGVLYLRNKQTGGLFPVTSESLKANRDFNKSKKLQSLYKQVQKLEKESSNINGNSDRSNNRRYKLDEQIKDLKSEINNPSKRTIKAPKKPDIYDKNKSQRQDNLFKDINKMVNKIHNNQYKSAEELRNELFKSVRKNKGNSKTYRNK